MYNENIKISEKYHDLKFTQNHNFFQPCVKIYIAIVHKSNPLERKSAVWNCYYSSFRNRSCSTDPNVTLATSGSNYDQIGATFFAVFNASTYLNNSIVGSMPGINYSYLIMQVFRISHIKRQFSIALY